MASPVHQKFGVRPSRSSINNCRRAPNKLDRAWVVRAVAVKQKLLACDGRLFPRKCSAPNGTVRRLRIFVSPLAWHPEGTGRTGAAKTDLSPQSVKSLRNFSV